MTAKSSPELPVLPDIYLEQMAATIWAAMLMINSQHDGDWEGSYDFIEAIDHARAIRLAARKPYP